MGCDWYEQEMFAQDLAILNELYAALKILEHIERKTADPEILDCLLRLESHLVGLDLLLRLDVVRQCPVSDDIGEHTCN